VGRTGTAVYCIDLWTKRRTLHRPIGSDRSPGRCDYGEIARCRARGLEISEIGMECESWATLNIAFTPFAKGDNA
jgi:hypothetical protein